MDTDKEPNLHDLVITKKSTVMDTNFVSQFKVTRLIRDSSCKLLSAVSSITQGVINPISKSDGL